MRHVKHAMDLLQYANAKGVSGEIALVFNQPGALPAAALEDLVQQIKAFDVDVAQAEQA